MNEIWQQLSRDILKNIFKYLPPKYIKTEIIRWLTKEEILFMLNNTTFEKSIEYKNYTACILYKNLCLINNLDIDWKNVSYEQKLSEDFIREFQDKVYWWNISEKQKLSESFIIEFQDKLHWGNISVSQKLSDNFIREFQDKVDWGFISARQKLSDNFIREFQDKVHWLDRSLFKLSLWQQFKREL